MATTSARDQSHWLTFLERLAAHGDLDYTSDDRHAAAVLAHCPCPQHGEDGTDQHPSLRAFLNDDGVVVLKCRAGCPTPLVLDALGLTYSSLYPADADQRTSPADDDLRAVVYDALLDFLPLAPRHERDLLTRGFTPDEVRQARYKTLTEDLLPRLDAHLAGRFPRDDLARVPGFDDGGTLLHNRLHCGLVVPLRKPHPHGLTPRVYLLKARRTQRPKYVLWQSAHLPAEPGYHWPLFNERLQGDTLRIAEGEFKADLCALRLKTPTVSMPGVEHGKGVLDFCNGRLDAVRTDGLTVAWDWADVLRKTAIRRALFVFLDGLSLRGYPAGIEVWDDSPVEGTGALLLKGIDDALAAGRPIVRLPATVARARLLDLIDSPSSSSSPAVIAPLVAAPSDKTSSTLPVPLPDVTATPTPGIAGSVAAVTQEPAPFPLHVLPPEVAGWVTSESQLLGTPVDYLACSCLAVAGRALGTNLQVSVLPGWGEYANLYLAVVGPPSSTKSAAVKRAVAPIFELQEEADDAEKARRKAHGELVAIANSQSKSAKAKSSLPPPPPVGHHYYVDDANLEGLVARLTSNRASPERSDMALLYYRDEISAWVRSFNQYRRGEGADKEFYLSIWGGGSVKVDRKSQEGGVIYLKKPFLAVLGSTTPDMLGVLDEKDGKADGFFQRLLFSIPRPSPAFRLPPKPALAPPGRVWDVVVRRLFLWQTPATLLPTQEAYDLLREHYERQARLIEADSSDSDTKAMAGKHRAYVLRLALILHALRVALGHAKTGQLAPHGAADGKPSLRPVTDMGHVEAADVEGAVALVAYFQAHYALARHLMRQGPEERRITDFVAWVAGLPSCRVGLSDVYRRKQFSCKGKSDAQKLFRSAEDRGLGIVVDRDGEVVFFARTAASSSSQPTTPVTADINLTASAPDGHAFISEGDK